MIFVPIATMKQQEKGMAKKAEIEALRNDDAFMSDLLGRWYDDAVAAKNGDKTKKGAANYCDLDYLGKNKIDGKAIDRDAFIKIRFDDKLDAKSGFLGLGGTTYTYDGVEIETKRKTAKSCLSEMPRAANLIKA